MPTRNDYNKTLDALRDLLRLRPLTARQIAAEFNCCRPVAYKRLRALEKRGDAVFKLADKRNRPGPEATAYGVRP